MPQIEREINPLVQIAADAIWEAYERLRAEHDPVAKGELREEVIHAIIRAAIITNALEIESELRLTPVFYN